MTLERTTDQSGPATMTIFFSPDPESSTKRLERGSATGSLVNDKLKTIDMKHRDETEILAEFLKITNGEEVIASEEDKLKLQESEQQSAQTEQDKTRSRLDLEAKRSEKRLLEQARHAVGGLRM
ncbi:MAG: hypothetical protein LQ340_005761 [Diploschistes diacapsis]|nr:MAG: hypothetical protein LQ340_005761 [Diploschistes diacapsis]